MAANADPAFRLADGAPSRRIDGDPEGERQVVAVAPLRIDLTGGFTDIPPFSSSVDSVHINAAFDLTVMVRCQMRRDRQVRVGFARTSHSAAAEVTEGRRRFVEAVRAGVAEFTSDRGVDLSIGSEAPAGSGLGSSGAILVAAIRACATAANIQLTAAAAAKKAIAAAAAAGIVGGQQDEFAAAHGSLRAYVFGQSDCVQMRDFAASEGWEYLEETLLVVQFGVHGRRSDVVAEVVNAVRGADRKTIGALHRLQALAQELLALFNEARFEEFPQYLQRIREAQRVLHPEICCPVTESIMGAARQEIPELEYKILGGGGTGSCALVHVPAHCRTTALAFLGKRAERVLRIKVQTHGARAEFADSRLGLSA